MILSPLYLRAENVNSDIDVLLVLNRAVVSAGGNQDPNM